MIEQIVVSILALLVWAVELYQMAVVVSALLSWVSPDPHNPIVRFIRQITEPALRPISNAMRGITRQFGIDLSPLVLIVSLTILQSTIHRTIIVIQN